MGRGFVTAGLLSGLGGAATSIAKTMEQRRAEALEAAQRLAKEQREREYKVADDEKEQQYALDRIDRTTDRQLEVQDRNQKFQAGQAADDRTYKRNERLEEQKFKQNMAVLESNLTAGRQAAEWQRDRQNVQTTFTNEDGKLVYVTKDGRAVTTDVPGARERTDTNGMDVVTDPVTGATSGGGQKKLTSNVPPAQAAWRSTFNRDYRTSVNEDPRFKNASADERFVASVERAIKFEGAANMPASVKAEYDRVKARLAAKGR